MQKHTLAAERPLHLRCPKGESNCEAGYTWEDPSDSSNYACVKDAELLPTTCLAAEVSCGFIADGCGATLDCGGPCPEPVWQRCR